MLASLIGVDGAPPPLAALTINDDEEDNIILSTMPSSPALADSRRRFFFADFPMIRRRVVRRLFGWICDLNLARTNDSSCLTQVKVPASSLNCKLI